MRRVPSVTGLSVNTVCGDVDLLKKRAVSSMPLGVGPYQLPPLSQSPEALVSHSVRPVSVPVKPMSPICIFALPLVPVKTILYEVYEVELVKGMTGPAVDRPAGSVKAPVPICVQFSPPFPSPSSTFVPEIGSLVP